MTSHPDDEALSAFVDGEAPEWAAHVAVCPSCRAGVETLRAVQATVAVPVAPPAPEERDRAIAAAVAEAGGARRPAPVELPAPGGSPRVRWLVPASIAAVLLLVVGAGSVLVRSGHARDRTSATAQAPARVPQPVQSGGAGGSANGGAAARSAPPVGDLGEIPDAPTLTARARLSRGVGAAGNSGAASDVGGAAASTPAVPSNPAAAPTGSGSINSGASVVGTRPCEEQARALDPSLREVVYFATATHLGAPAIVLGFSTGPAPAPVTLLLLAQSDCGVVLRAAGP